MRTPILFLSLAALAAIGFTASPQTRASDLRVYVDLGDIIFDYGRPYYRHGHVPLYVEHLHYGPPRYYYHRPAHHRHYHPPGYVVRYYTPPPRHYRGHGHHHRDKHADRDHRRDWGHDPDRGRDRDHRRHRRHDD